MKLILSLLFCVLPARAEMFRGPLSSAMGGTGRAAMDSAEAAFLNPALIPLLKDYEFDGYFRDGYQDSGQHRNAYGLGAGDNSKTVIFPAAINYLRLRDTGRASEPVDGELWHLAFGKMIRKDLSVGATVYRVTYKGNTLPMTTQWNYSLGALYMASSDIGFAYTLNNIAKPGSDVPVDLREALQQGVGFFASVFEIARVRADITRDEVNNPSKKMVYMLGFENLSGDFVIVRGGYRHDDQRGQNYLTAGLGFNGPRLKFDYSFEKNLVGTYGALHSVDMRIPF